MRAHVILVGLSLLAAPASQLGARAFTADGRSLVNSDRASQPDVPEEVRRLSEDARALRKAGQYDKALPLAERALSISERALGPDHVNVADALHFLAVLHDDRHDYSRAEPLNQRALAIREKAYGPDHPDVARSLFNLAWIYQTRQDFAKAESSYRRALTIQERALGRDHSDVATTLNDLAVLYSRTGDLDQAIVTNQRVLEIRERALGPDAPGVARALGNLALVYEKKGEYAQSHALYQRAIPIYEKAQGPEHPDVAYVLNGLAKVFVLNGELANAEPLFLRALAIREKALGPDHTWVAETLSGLAGLYRDKGDYAKAEPLYRRDLAITDKKLGPNHLYAAATLNNLAGIHRRQGEYAKAEPLYRRALAIQEKALGPDHAEVGWTLNQLGWLYADQPNSESQADDFFRRSLAISEKALSPDHPRAASALSGLATIAESHGDAAGAEGFYQRALAIQEKALGPDHPDVVTTLESLAGLYLDRGELKPSLRLRLRAQEARERQLGRNLTLGSERQKLTYLKLFAADIDYALTMHARLLPGDPQALDLAFTTLLRRKGRALDATGDNVATLRLHADPGDQEVLSRLSDARSRLAAVTLRGPGTPGTAAYRAQLRRLEDTIEQLEADVSARSVEFRSQSRPITLAAVQSAIPETAALVEFASYRSRIDKNEGESATRYVAYVLSAQGGPRWVDLGVAADIDRAVDAWRRSLRDPKRGDARKLARALDAKVMQPVRALIGSSRHLLMSPDGELNLIPFAALLDEQNRYLVERYTLTYLTSGRDLLRLQVPRESRSAATVVAAPAFGEPALITSAVTGARKGSASSVSVPRVDYSQTFFGPLPGVADEVRALRKLLPEAAFLVGHEATEAALKRIRGPRILHIATHGFFLRGGDDAAGSAPAPDGSRLGKWAAWADNPMLRAGLALAGANQGRNGDDDGVLTALETASLDLWGTELVVLSACDTGVGEVKQGDGVYGLRRSLVLAGAESQLMSLWPVSDRSTRDLMIGFYQQLSKGDGRSDALRHVQLRMLRESPRAHPYYWASFIQSGAWAKLEATR